MQLSAASLSRPDGARMPRGEPLLPQIAAILSLLRSRVANPAKMQQLFLGRALYMEILQKCSILPVQSRNEAEMRKIDVLLQQFLLRCVFCGENPAPVQDFYDFYPGKPADWPKQAAEATLPACGVAPARSVAPACGVASGCSVARARCGTPARSRAPVRRGAPARSGAPARGGAPARSRARARRGAPACRSGFLLADEDEDEDVGVRRLHDGHMA